MGMRARPVMSSPRQGEILLEFNLVDAKLSNLKFERPGLHLPAQLDPQRMTPDRQSKGSRRLSRSTASGRSIFVSADFTGAFLGRRKGEEGNDRRRVQKVSRLAAWPTGHGSSRRSPSSCDRAICRPRGEVPESQGQGVEAKIAPPATFCARSPCPSPAKTGR